MKKLNLTIITTVIASLAMSMVFFQPTTTEASNGVLPNATPSPRKIRKAPTSTGDQPEMQITGSRKRSRQTSAQYNPKEIGIDKIKAKKPAGFVSPSSDPHGRRKQPRRKRSN